MTGHGLHIVLQLHLHEIKVVEPFNLSNCGSWVDVGIKSYGHLKFKGPNPIIYNFATWPVIYELGNPTLFMIGHSVLFYIFWLILVHLVCVDFSNPFKSSKVINDSIHGSTKWIAYNQASSTLRYMLFAIMRKLGGLEAS